MARGGECFLVDGLTRRSDVKLGLSDGERLGLSAGNLKMSA